jgi:uncharacterized protein YlzI (FlbEa/FlbD family)|tara:strand:- start:2311 stop:2949 length:639 start_codon:yes stop_codon:yes gene_type:complete
MSYESIIEAKKYHEQNPTHWIGESLGEYKHHIWDIIHRNKYKHILDYGSGKAKFHKLLFNTSKTPGAPLNINIVPYDPAYEPFSTKPTGKFELVLCIDVMEHVQEDKVEEVLEDIFSFANDVFITISCYPATQILLNGKNAHYTIKESEWWKEKLKPYDGKYTAIFQTRPERGESIINKEEWNPNAITLDKLKRKDATLSKVQKDKSQLLYK